MEQETRKLCRKEQTVKGELFRGERLNCPRKGRLLRRIITIIEWGRERRRERRGEGA